MLEINSLTKSFGGLIAVNSVSLEIKDGELHSLIGPNGAGKTTLFNMITGGLKPDEGSIVHNGEDITNLDPHEINNHGLARSFQITSIFPELTVFENLRVVAQAKSDSRMSMFKSKNDVTEALDEAERLIELLDLSEFRDREAKDISHGQKRSLEIGLALASDPDILMLDEPTAGMSAEETGEMIELLHDLKTEYTIFLVEHDMDVVMSQSDRITVLNQGQIIVTDVPENIQDNQKVRDAYLGQEEVTADV